MLIIAFLLIVLIVVDINIKRTKFQIYQDNSSSLSRYEEISKLMDQKRNLEDLLLDTPLRNKDNLKNIRSQICDLEDQIDQLYNGDWR